MREDRRRVPGRPRLLRTLNDRLALELLIEAGPLTRQQVSDRTGLSRPTASLMLTRLEAGGLVVRTGTAGGGRGPLAAVYGVPPRSILSAALDVRPGGARAAVLDVGGEVLGRATVPVDPCADAGHTVSGVLEAACAPAGVCPRDLAHVVVGVGAAYDHEADVLADVEHLPGWRSPGVGRSVGGRLGVAVHLENDVNLAHVGERASRTGGPDGPLPDGAALLWFGDGVGLAVDLGGRLHRGASGRAGEIGYVLAPPPEGDGRRDVQSLLGGPALVAHAAAFGLTRAGDRPPGAAGDPAAWADCGDVVAQAVSLARSDERGRGARPFLADVAARLAAVLEPVLAVLDPSVVVLAGPGGTAGGGLLAGLVESDVRARARWSGPVLPTLAGPDAVLLGGRARATQITRERLLARVGTTVEPVAT